VNMPPLTLEEKLQSAIINNSSNEIKQFFKSNPTFPKDHNFSKGRGARFTPLTYAAAMGSMEAVSVLLKQGADPNVMDEFDLPPLVRATQFQLVDHTKQRATIAAIFAELLKNKANADFTLADGATLLCLLAQDGYTEAAEVFLKYAPHLLNKTRHDFKCPLLLAVEFKHLDMVRLLVKYKADPNLKIKKEKTILMGAVIVNADKELVKEILEAENKPDIDARDSDGATALMSACQNNNVGLVKLLLEKGANTSLLAFNNQAAAITIAAQTGNFGIISLFRNRPLATGLCMHPCFVLLLIKLDNEKIFEMIVKELLNQGYVFNDDRFKESFSATIKLSELWKYEILEKHGATLTKSTTTNGDIAVQLSSHATEVASESVIENIMPKQENFLNELEREFINKRGLFLQESSYKEKLNALITMMKMIPNDLTEDLAESLSLTNVFNELVRNHFVILSDNGAPGKDYFFSSSAFFAIGAYVPILTDDVVFVASAKKFYAKACRFFFNSNPEFVENLELYFEYASCGEEELAFFNEIVGGLTIRQFDPDLLEETMDILSGFVKTTLALDNKDVLTQTRKLDLTLYYLNFLKIYPTETPDEYLSVINTARNLLSTLGKKYSRYQEYTQLLNEVEFKCIYNLAIKSKDPEDVQEAQQLLKSENRFSVKERQQYAEKLGALIPVENEPSKKLPEFGKRKTKPRAAPAPVEQKKEEITGSDSENIDAKITLLREVERAAEAERKKEADHYLKLRKDEAKRRRNEKKLAFNTSVAPPPAEPARKWSENEVRQFFASIIKPADKLLMLDHPGGGEPGTYWACLSVDPKAFANPNEYQLYLGKFNEARVRNDDKDSGIVHVNDHYYLRVQKRLPRVHAAEFQIENGPTFLQFGDYKSHIEHVKAMKKAPPPATRLSEKIS
jgi:ankyrin repeat protein/uncharacterized protein YfkK (UPF0435 family)